MLAVAVIVVVVVVAAAATVGVAISRSFVRSTSSSRCGGGDGGMWCQQQKPYPRHYKSAKSQERGDQQYQQHMVVRAVTWLTRGRASLDIETRSLCFCGLDGPATLGQSSRSRSPCLQVLTSYEFFSGSQAPGKIFSMKPLPAITSCLGLMMLLRCCGCLPKSSLH